MEAKREVALLFVNECTEGKVMNEFGPEKNGGNRWRADHRIRLPGVNDRDRI